MEDLQQPPARKSSKLDVHPLIPLSNFEDKMREVLPSRQKKCRDAKPSISANKQKSAKPDLDEYIKKNSDTAKM